VSSSWSTFIQKNVVTHVKRLAVVVEGKMSRWIPRENYRYINFDKDGWTIE